VNAVLSVLDQHRVEEDIRHFQGEEEGEVREVRLSVLPAALEAKLENWLVQRRKR